ALTDRVAGLALSVARRVAAHALRAEGAGALAVSAANRAKCLLRHARGAVAVEARRTGSAARATGRATGVRPVAQVGAAAGGAGAHRRNQGAGAGRRVTLIA